MLNYQTQNGQNIFDLVLNTNGNLNNTYALIQANTEIANIESVPIGIIVTYAPAPVTPPIIASPGIPPIVSSAQFSSVANQNIYDIALQVYGDLNMTYKLIQDSNFSNLLTYPQPTTIFIFNPQLTTDAIFASYLSKNGIVINTAQTMAEQNGGRIPLESAGTGTPLEAAGGGFLFAAGS